MPKKSTKRPTQSESEISTEDFAESMILGVTSDGECVYIHTFEDDIMALEFLETMIAGFRADVLKSLMRRNYN
jgi:hypothetical protein